jgi:hypothetical protein
MDCLAFSLAQPLVFHSVLKDTFLLMFRSTVCDVDYILEQKVIAKVCTSFNCRKKTTPNMSDAINKSCLSRSIFSVCAVRSLHHLSSSVITSAQTRLGMSRIVNNNDNIL